jgi:hypothetical protein
MELGDLGSLAIAAVDFTKLSPKFLNLHYP